MRGSVRGGLTLLEQSFFSASSFVISVAAVRVFDPPSLVRFGLLNQVTFGAVALLSEAFIVPVFLEGTSKNLQRLFRTLATAACACILLSLAFWRVVATADPLSHETLSATATGLGCIAYMSVRANNYHHRLVLNNLRLAAVQLGLTLTGLLVLMQFNVRSDVTPFLLLNASTFLMPVSISLWRDLSQKHPGEAAAARRWPWAATVALRVVLWNVLPLAVLGRVHGAATAAILVVTLTAIAPVQLIAAAGGALVLPHAAGRGSLLDALHDVFKPISLSVGTAAATAAVAVIVPVWAAVLHGQTNLGRGDITWAVMAAEGLLGSSVLSVQYRIAQAPFAFIFNVLVSGISGITCALMGFPGAAVGVPMLLSTAMGAHFMLRVSKRDQTTEHSTTVSARKGQVI